MPADLVMAMTMPIVTTDLGERIASHYAGFAKMQGIMEEFHKGLNGLSKSDVLKFMLEDNCSVVVRPSGTEPKLKTYISVSTDYKEEAENEYSG